MEPDRSFSRHSSGANPKPNRHHNTQESLSNAAKRSDALLLDLRTSLRGANAVEAIIILELIEQWSKLSLKLKMLEDATV